MANNKTKFQKAVYTEEQRKERAVIKRMIKQGKASRYSLATGPNGNLERERTKVTVFHRNGVKVAKQRPRLTLRRVSNLK